MSWRECTLGDVVKLQRGHDLPDRVRVDGPVPVVSSAGITGRHNVAKAEPPGVVTGRYGTIGEVYYLDEPYWPLNTALYAVDFRGNLPRYVAYLLEATLKNYQSEKAAVPGVDRNVLHAIKVKAADPATQERIVETLLAFDDLIGNSRKRIALLEEAARLLYREWFVHLRFPGHEHVQVVDGLPDGWQRRFLGDVCENWDRKRVPLSVLEREKRRGPYPYHGAAGVLDYLDGYLFDGRYLLVGEDGTVITPRGTPVLQLADGQFWVNNHAHVLSAGEASAEFLYCMLSDYRIQGHVTGVAQPKVTQQSLNRIPLILPSSALRAAFQDAVGPMFDQRFALERYNRKLADARDLLLPRLMNGEIAV